MISRLQWQRAITILWILYAIGYAPKNWWLLLPVFGMLLEAYTLLRDWEN